MFNKFISSPMVKVAARYGAIAGVLCIVFVITFFKMGNSPFLINPYADFRVVLFAILIFFCLKEIRDFYQGGVLPMWQGMVSGLLFLTATSIVAALGIFIYGALQPGLVSNHITEFAREINNYPDDIVKRIGKDVLDRSLAALPSTTIGDLVTRYVGQTLIIGFFITVIISVILRRQPKTA